MVMRILDKIYIKIIYDIVQYVIAVAVAVIVLDTVHLASCN